MITSVRGLLAEVHDDRIFVSVGADTLVLELLVPASDPPLWRDALGQAVLVHTRLYLEGDGSSSGGGELRLLGFRTALDRGFFELLVTVKGIGPRKALRALTRPASDLAAAIDARDARLLAGLPGIGKRTAEQIIAELSGKVTEFRVAGGASVVAPASRASAAGHAGTRPPAQEDAILTLLALGERRADAETLLDRVLAESPELATTDQLVRAMLLLRTARG